MFYDQYLEQPKRDNFTLSSMYSYFELTRVGTRIDNGFILMFLQYALRWFRNYTRYLF